MFDYVFRWKSNSKRLSMYRRRCRVLASGTKNSVMIEFENGQREIVSKYAVKKAKKMSDLPMFKNT